MRLAREADLKRGFVVALLGAESSGKTSLSLQLQQALLQEGRSVALVPEYLREFCEQAGRTPREDEQAGISETQSARIEAAAQQHEIVIADTSALMIAVYSEFIFRDRSLHASALAAQGRCDLTLLMALDLPWQADGLMRDGPQVREPVDALLRGALLDARLPYSVVSGQAEARTTSALKALRHGLSLKAQGPARSTARWQAHCERCGDPDCERRLLGRIQAR